MKSILSDEKKCCICGSLHAQLHHIYYGTGNRKISDRNGFTVYLCAEHHTGKYGVHFNKSLDLYFKTLAQMEFEKNHTREEFTRLIGKNYL